VQLGHTVTQFLILGLISVSLNTLADLVVVALAVPLGRKLAGNRRFRRNQRTATGVAMIGLGTFVALADTR
jgi:threonine/homoserine/homoserine lactone efflux protein